MRLRFGNDAILAGINTILSDDPALTIRLPGKTKPPKALRRFVLDSDARVPLSAQVLSDTHKASTTILASETASDQKIAEIEKVATVWRIPRKETGLDLKFVLKRMGEENITSLLVEGGGEAIASFFAEKAAHRICFFYAPMIIGGRNARKSVAGRGFQFPGDAPRLANVKWRRLGPDLLLTAAVAG